MNITFKTKLTRQALFDYNIYHTYNSFSGILGGVVGALFIVAFASNLQPIYLIAGVVILVYLPVTLWLNTAQAVKKDESKITPFTYSLTDEGVKVTVGEEETEENTLFVPWDGFKKACSTRKSILLYTNKKSAFVFVRKDMGPVTNEVIAAICTHMDPKRIRIRY